MSPRISQGKIFDIFEMFDIPIKIFFLIFDFHTDSVKTWLKMSSEHKTRHKNKIMH